MSKKNRGNEPYLKGTFISVLVVGIIICILWFTVFGIYVTR